MSVPATLLDQIKQDAATRASVPAAQVQVVSVEEVEWPTPALGCPLPGRLYAQVIVDGYRIILQAGSRRLEYHTDRASRWETC